MSIGSSERAGEGGGPDRDVVLSTRARLARNLAGAPFPERCDEATLRRCANAVRRAARADSDRLADLEAVNVASLTDRERAALVGGQRISSDLASAGPERWALLDAAGVLSVLVNEEDHVRIQAVLPGCAPDAALRRADDCAVRLGHTLEYACVPERWGYLTASPSNLGTGLRVSVLVHLPALGMTGGREERLRAAHDLDTAIRGLYGEGSDSSGDLFQVSNAVAFGRSAAALADRVRGVARYLVSEERAARERLRTDPRVDRALEAARGALSAPRLTPGEALDILSAFRLAALLGRVPGPDDAAFARLVRELRPGSDADDMRRAARLRGALPGATG